MPTPSDTPSAQVSDELAVSITVDTLVQRLNAIIGSLTTQLAQEQLAAQAIRERAERLLMERDEKIVDMESRLAQTGEPVADCEVDG